MRLGSRNPSEHRRNQRLGRSPSVGICDRVTVWVTGVPTSLDNGRRSPRKLLSALVARLLGRKP